MLCTCLLWLTVTSEQGGGGGRGGAVGVGNVRKGQQMDSWMDSMDQIVRACNDYMLASKALCMVTVEPLYKGHHWDQLAVLYREVSLIQR